MLRLLIASLLMLLPAGLVEQNTNFAENNLILREKNIKRSEKSDEFVSYWMDDFRKDDEGEIIPICDITFNEYTVMIAKYIDLEKTDRLIVDATPDYEEIGRAHV